VPRPLEADPASELREAIALVLGRANPKGALSLLTR